jgi:hypothetical protein
MDTSIDRFEWEVMDAVAYLLDHGWPPDELVDAVGEDPGLGSCAGEIVTLAIVCHAGYWLSVPGLGGLLAQVDEFAAGFHHYVGATGPGWLAIWLHRHPGDGCVVLDEVIWFLVTLVAPSAIPIYEPSVEKIWALQR